ncbi:hypothetical protein FXO38_36639 [Capsicum annuum]|nr:hypothetical protein FXO37_36679 [Capsicum annuum]KAF3612746.1 hypothetical protein FXO38_36639 [Capsicum annuum]
MLKENLALENLQSLQPQSTLGYASPRLRAFSAGKDAAFKMFQTIDRPIDPYDMKGQKLVDISGDIELKNVHCCCPARLNESIFDGLSISILKGTTTALVGRIGSGKSTVIGLIIRFYDPQAGEVLIDDSHLELMRNKEVAYVQLIQLQELSKYSGEQELNGLDSEEIFINPKDRSNHQIFVPRSTSRDSTRIENSSHYSSSISISVVDKTVAEYHDPNSIVVLRNDKDNTLSLGFDEQT